VCVCVCVPWESLEPAVDAMYFIGTSCKQSSVRSTSVSC